MADSILRLKVESQEYDNKLKRAADGLTRYADQCRKVGGTLQHVDEGVTDFARSLGQMETVANTARGKLSELTKAYTELSVQYRQMTDEEKKGEYGKALSASLEQLKGRIQDSKHELDEVNKSINGGGGLSGALESLSGKLGMSIQSFMGMGTAMAAGTTALSVAKDAFFASESTVDEWGRVMASSQSVYEGFLTAINTGDISGYLDRINDIVQAARKAYDELDKLGTMKTIQAPQISAQQTENDRMRNMIMTGRYIAPMDGRRNAVFNGKEMQNGQQLTPGQIRALEKQLQSGTQKIVGLYNNEIKQTSKAIDAYYNKLAKVNGITLEEYKKGTSSWAEFEKRMRGNEEYQRFEREHTTIDSRTGISHRDKAVNPYAEFRNWNVNRVDKQGQNSLNDLVGLIQQRDQKMAQAYNMQAQAQRTINRVEGTTVRKILGGGGIGSGGSSSQTPQQQAAAKYAQAEKDYQQALEMAALQLEAGTTTSVDAKKKELQAAEGLWKAIGDAREVYDSPELQQAQAQTAEKIKALGGEVNALVEQQKKAQESARALDQAQKKLAEAQQLLSDALATGNLKDINAAKKAVKNAQAGVDKITTSRPVVTQQSVQPVSVPVVFTASNMQEFQSKLKEQLNGTEIGTKLYNDITANLADAKKKELQAAEGLWKAIGDAREVYDSPELQQAQAQAAEKIKALGGEVNALVEQQKKAQESARALDQAQKKLAEAQQQLSDALATGNLKDINAAKKAVKTAQAGVDKITTSRPVVTQQSVQPVSVPVVFTASNMQEFQSKLKEQLNGTEIGTKLYNDITANLADANALSNLMQTAIQNGIDIAQFEPQKLWSKVFGETPGDYISDDLWSSILNKLNAQIAANGGDQISLNTATGETSKKTEQGNRDLIGTMNQAIGAIGSIKGGLEKMGIDLPDEIDDMLGGLQGLMQVVQGVSTIISIFSTTAETANTAAVIANTTAIGALIPAMYAAAASGFIPFAHGGIVHAANGYVPGNYMSGDRVPALLNSGEMVLNKAQQSTLASALQDSGIGNMQLEAVVRGEDLRFVLNSNGRRTGRGEIVTTNFR